MNIVMNLVLALQILTALVMIGLVLIQHGKGADMGASFGSGASGSLFGATGSANFLSRSTAVCAMVFFVCTLSLAYTANDRPQVHGGQRPRSAGSGRVGAAGRRFRRERLRESRERCRGDRLGAACRRRFRCLAHTDPACRRLAGGIRSSRDPAEVKRPRLEFKVARRATPHASRAAKSSAADVVKLVDTLS